MDNFKITKTILENINEQNDRINECVDIVNGYTTDEVTRVRQEEERVKQEIIRQEQYNANENKFVAINNQLEHMETLNILNYSHLCKNTNGVIDWTNAFQQSFNDLSDCGTLIIPKGEYHCDKAILTDKNSIIIQCNGIIKPLPNKQPLFGTFYFKNINNSLFLGLYFNGNKQNITHNGEIGVDCMLALENCSNITFDSFVVENTIMSGVCSNGKCKNVEFKNYRLTSIGEHGFYLSGGENTDIKFINGEVTNIGVNPLNLTTSHSCCVFKSRNSKEELALNDKWFIENLSYNQTINNNYNHGVIWAMDLPNIFVKNITVAGASTYFSMLGKGLENFKCDNINVENKLIYNINNELQTDINYTIFNSNINGNNNCFNVVKRYENCKFNMQGKSLWLSYDDISINSEKTEFINCTFISENEKIYLKKLEQDLIFNNCKFIKIGEQNTGIFLNVGETSANENNKIMFDNCIANEFSYSGMLGIYNKCNLEIKNSCFKGYIRNYNSAILKSFKVSNFICGTPKLDTYVNSENWLIGDVFNTSFYNMSRNIRQYTLKANATQLNMDIRTFVCKNVDLTKNVIIIPSKPIDFTIEMTTQNIIVVKPITVQSTNINFSLYINFSS